MWQLAYGKSGQYQLSSDEIISCVHSIKCPNYLSCHFNPSLVGGQREPPPPKFTSAMKLGRKRAMVKNFSKRQKNWYVMTIHSMHSGIISIFSIVTTAKYSSVYPVYCLRLQYYKSQSFSIIHLTVSELYKNT